MKVALLRHDADLCLKVSYGKRHSISGRYKEPPTYDIDLDFIFYSGSQFSDLPWLLPVSFLMILNRSSNKKAPKALKKI